MLSCKRHGRRKPPVTLFEEHPPLEASAKCGLSELSDRAGSSLPLPPEPQTPHPCLLSTSYRPVAPGYPMPAVPARSLPLLITAILWLMLSGPAAQSPTDCVDALNQGILSLMHAAAQKIPPRTRLQQFDPVVRQNYDLEPALRVAASPDYDRAPP